MNYQELFTQIQTYTENQFPDTFVQVTTGGSATNVNAVSQINTFIRQAEDRIYNSVQIPSLRKNVTGNCTQYNKYLACPAGIFEFKYFFSAQLGSEKGQAVSATAVQSLIKQMISAETPKKPISDSQISNLLASQGFNVARRTVAKYRELMRIPSAHLRKR